MARLLYIQASPRTERSHSRAVADAFVEAYAEAHPGDDVDRLDLFQADLVPFDGLTVQAKYTILHGQAHSDEEAAAWKAVEETIAQFTAADKYVLAVPMWNFGIPYRLKQYIDILVQPGYTFAVTEQGYEGLLGGRPVFVAYARGGAYAPGTGYESADMQKPYLELILGFMGLTDVKSVIVEPTLQEGPDVGRQKREAAIEEARGLAAGF